MRRSTRYNRPGLSGSARSATLLGADGDGSTLTLNFTTGVLDPRLSFSRLSTATFINNSGLVAWAAANMMTRSQSQDNNSYWNAFGTAVTRTGSQTDPFGGSGAVKLDYDATSADAVISRTVSVQQGLQYTISVWLRADSGTVNNVRFGRGASAAGAYFPSLTTTWQRFSLTFTATGGSDGMELRVLNSGTPKTASFHVFGAQLEPGSTMRDYNPALLDVPYQAPRFDHDPTTLAPRGLLIEGSAINLLKYSAYADTSWIAYGGYTKAYTTGITSPAGDTSAVRVTFAAVGNGLYTNNTQMGYTNSVGATYTFSAWIRATSSTTNAKIRFGDSAVATGPDIPISTTWTRYSYQYTALANSGPVIQSASGTATGEFEMWGMQLETGSGASSYIPTGASQATRARDQVTLTNLSSINFSQTEGTCLTTVEVREKADSTFLPYGSFDTSGGGRCWWWLRHNLSTVSGTRLLGTAFNSGGSTGINTSNYVYNGGSGGVVKFATSLNTAASSMVFVISGGAPQTTTAAAFTLATAAQWGLNTSTDVTATALGSMWVQSFKYWPAALPNAQLQSLTL